MKNILVIDTGTSSMRAILFDPTGRILEQDQIKYFVETKDDVTVEQEASSFKEALIDLCKNMVIKTSKRNISIDAIALTAQRSSVMPVNEDGHPLTPVMMWYDKRPQSICDKLELEHGDEIYHTCGMRVKPMFSAPKMLWLKRHKPDIYKKTYKLIGIQDYLIYLLTGKFVTDVTFASRTSLLDIKRKEWSNKLISIFDIDQSKLCELVDVGSIVGNVTDEFIKATGINKNTQIITCGGDQQCSAVGQGLYKINQIGLTSGTATYAVAITNKPIFSLQKGMNVNVGSQKNTWIVEVSNMSSGAVYNWLRETLYEKDATIDRINQDVDQTPVNANGVMMLPSLAGRNLPQGDSLARGSFVNISFRTKRGDFARAAIEGIASEVVECLDVIKENVENQGNIKSAGGLSNLSAFNQIIADMSHVSIEKCQVKETTAVGAWAVAAISLKLYHTIEEALNEHIKHEADEEHIFEPSLKNHKLYHAQGKARSYIKENLYAQKYYELLENIKEIEQKGD